MALNLFAKKLSKKPIGTHVELTIDVGSSLEKVAGVITDSDFSTSVEITTHDGDERLLDYSLIKGFQETKSLEDILKSLSTGTKVRFSHGDEDNKEPCISGTVGENDGEESIEIIMSNGKEQILSYSIIRSLLVLPGGKAVPEPKSLAPDPIPPQPVQPPRPKKVSLHQQSPEDILNVNDGKLKAIFDVLPRNDRLKLSSVFERFKYGIKVNDRNKMEEAATQARQILFREEDKDYFWSREAVLFCGYLLRRVSIYDPEVFLIGECLEEAAYAAWKVDQYDLAGAYAIAALLNGTDNVQDMVIILASSVVKGDDISGLSKVSDYIPANLEPQFKNVVAEAFSAKGVQVSAEQDTAAALAMLSTLYPNTKMAEEVVYWLPEKKPEQNTPRAESSEPTPTKPTEPEFVYGVISKLNWSEHTGVISSDNGSAYTFRYQDIADSTLSKTIQECLSTNLDGKVYMVKFYADKATARNIQSDSALVDRARAVVADATRADRFEVAFELCKKAVETSDTRRALGDLIKYAIALYTSTQQNSYIKEALSLYEKYITFYPNNAFAVMDVAQCYNYLKKYPLMLEHAEKTLAFPGLLVRQRIAVLSSYLKMVKEYYEISGDKALLAKMLEKINELKNSYSKDFTTDPQVKKQYASIMLPYRVIAQCGMDMLEEAEADYANIPDACIYKEAMDALMAKTRLRLAPKVETVEPPQEKEAEEEFTPEQEYAAESYDEETFEEEAEEEVLPYVDTDGWDALKLTKKDVVDYALNITGPNRIPAILAYLRAGSALSDTIIPVYHVVALAANDPLAMPDYNITALVNALAGSDSDYHDLNDCCMGAAFLRTSFLSGRGYDYSAQGLRDSISISKQIPALRDAYDTLEEFRKEVGREIDIYADYRNHGVKKLNEDLNITVRHADELYTKFVLTPAREGVRFARLLETKKIVFARDGYLATMLHHIMERNHDALEAEKEHFVATYLNGVSQFSRKQLDSDVIDEMISTCWDQAGKGMQMKKLNETLQGNRRNNLRSNISDILATICQWYAVSEQSAGLTWRTEQGVEAYQRLRPQLMNQLCQISEECHAEMESCPDPELCTGLFLLASAAQELYARLDGSWKYEQEKYLYVDFLRSNQITLNEDFMPDLTSTFCVLPEFNILARIRNHVEADNLSFQEQLDQIYGVDKTCNNYGTADRIVEYLNAVGENESVSIPDNHELFISHTEMQIDMRYRSFRETYALAMNYGQIIKSDYFCSTLEETVKYWYVRCKETKNYGFFTSILLQAENQIHASAQQYETQLDEQLDALISSNQQYFDSHPDYAEAIRAQIANQNFTVAEDWMSRIRIGDFSLDVQQPEAITYLERFWNSYVVTYNQVAESRRPLSALLGRRDIHNKDTKGAQQLIDNWLNNGNPSNSERIEQLLNLLGWQNISVRQYQFAEVPRGEFYEVRKESSETGLTTPLHPIAAFGSNLEKKRMYVVCLYGIYDCDRLYEKMRTLDVISGSKIILLDYALGQADRRALARKLKKRESGLRNVNLVIDRVLITHLANNYNENLINRILMATAMPFTYCQPYVVESAHTMPPEIFIGRKDELLKIEQPDGVNLIYGGRQLGKSALFKKALFDIDGRQNQKAVLVDINGLDCAAAARKVSFELIDRKITPNAQITDDWDVLCMNITHHMRAAGEEIRYFLLMLDEADDFINDCANCNYRPMVALKDIQQSMPGQFKYVLAGLHNIVKFNRQVALGNNSVITHMPSIKITPFHTPEAMELLTGPLSYLGFSLPSKVTTSQILATCNYFPGLIQLYAKKLIESVRNADYAGYDIKKTPPYVVSDEHLRRVMADKEFVEEIHNKFEATLTLDQKQGSFYYPLTLLIGWMYNVANSKSGYTARDVMHHAKDLAISSLADLDLEKIDTLLMELQDLNILRSVSNDSYLLASKNFRDLLGSDEEIFEKLMNFGGVAV